MKKVNKRFDQLSKRKYIKSMCLRVLLEHASVHREHTPLSTVSKLCHACVDFVDSSLLRGYTPF